jgi:hypothetical protein
MQRLTAVLALALLVAVPLARADQCQLVDPAVAQRAARAIQASHGRVLAYCAPCGDPMPATSAAFTPREVHAGTESLFIDGREVDLAYTYLEVGQGLFENVALRTGCDAVDVPPALRISGTTFLTARLGAVPAALRALGWGTPPRVEPRRVRPG